MSNEIGTRAPSVHKSSSASTPKPPTSIWDQGALLCRVSGGKVFYGTVVSSDQHLDFIVVQASNFSKTGVPLVVHWSGTRDEFQRTWRFSKYEGAA